MDFATRLAAAWDRTGAALCVGLDPIIERMPETIRSQPRPVLAFNRMVIDATADLACAFKPQHAHHAAVGAEEDLAETIAYLRQRAPHAIVILDAKRGDIGSTADMYAREAFVRYGADAVTVNPYLGDDSITPFIGDATHAAVVLCRTSNPSAPQVQNADNQGLPLYRYVANRAQTVWNAKRNVMLVVGATDIDDLARVRATAPDLPFLVPGVGEQGGSASEVMRAGRAADGRGLIVSSSRAILYAGDAAAIRSVAQRTADDLRF